MKLLLTALTLFVLAVAGASASDLEKEARWRAQIVDALLDGEAVDLNAGDLTFLGIYTEAEEPTGRAAIIAHGIGVHPDWPQVVLPLRTGLPLHGWSTLSIQMPILPNEATTADYAPLFAEVPPRFEAAIAYLKEKGADRIAIIGHSLGTLMAADYLGSHPDAAVAFVAVGFSLSEAEAAKLNSKRLVEGLRIPTLDLYGQNDDEDILETAEARAAVALSAGNAQYHQVQVPEANHFFDGQEDALVETTVQWLGQTVPVN